jgi:hypothetical protein
MPNALLWDSLFQPKKNLFKLQTDPFELSVKAFFAGFVGHQSNAAMDLSKLFEQKPWSLSHVGTGL